MASAKQIAWRKKFAKKYGKKKAKSKKSKASPKSKISAFDRGYKAGYHKATSDVEKYWVDSGTVVGFGKQ